MTAASPGEEAAVETFEAEIRVTPREGILDPEGETIARALEHLGYGEVERVRSGRLIRMRLRAADARTGRERVESMCEELIANPVIEDYEVRLEPGARADAGDGA